ncbi:MAG: NnrU family protein [Pararhodobacter sp.]|nr:NnrU family protein [Pararhodobacter sp.]
MSGWGGYVAAWAFFLFTHAVPVRPPLRPWLVARLGQGGFTLAYSALSLAALAWLFVAAGRAPHVPLWPTPPMAHWLVLVAMVPACLLLALTLGRPNPLSFAGARNHAFDPARPGLEKHIRHPVLAALLIWALAHLAVNGDLAHALMFGGFALFAALGMAMIDRRRRREMGPDRWRAQIAQMRAARMNLPPAAGMRVLVGLAALAALVALHEWLSGVVMWPRFLP